MSTFVWIVSIRWSVSAGEGRMTIDPTHTTRAFDHRRPTTWVALVLVLFQLMLGVDHLVASAAAVSGAEDRAVGLLALCHGDGEIVHAPQGDDPPPPAAQPCILCSAAAVTGAGATPSAPEIAPVSLVVVDAADPLRAVATRALPLRLRYGVVRGPPSVLLV